MRATTGRPGRGRVAAVAAVAAVVLAACGSAVPPPPVPTAVDAAPPDVVMIIRHGEKPDGDHPGVDADGRRDDAALTATGWERAHRLADLLDPDRGRPPAGLTRPATVYAAGPTDNGEGQRTRETVTPLADRLAVPVDTDHGSGEEKALVRDVLHRPGPALISWQHQEIPAIVAAFPSVSPEPPSQWPDDRFDVVWTLTRTAHGWHFAQVPETALPDDGAGVIDG